jgi:phenylacetate-CoA ligase
MWGCVEVGLMGIECDAHEGMHLCDDMIICEFVDHDNRATSDPDKIDKILATSLYNTSLPMIRYEISDIAIPGMKPCKCGSVFPLIKEIRGRADDAFKYSGDVKVHPLVFRTPLGQHPMIQEYQVCQTENGALINIAKIGDVDDAALTSDLVLALEEQGMKDPDITLVFVDAVKRHAETGKLRRFFPL